MEKVLHAQEPAARHHKFDLESDFPMPKASGLIQRLRFQHVAILQGLYFAGTGIWPTAHMQSFIMFTGPKTDLWLVRTTGLLLASIGLVLFIAGVRKKRLFEFYLLGICSAVALAVIEILYVYQKIIPPIYLLDSAIEIILLVLWVFAIFMGRQPRTPEVPTSTG